MWVSSFDFGNLSAILKFHWCEYFPKKQYMMNKCILWCLYLSNIYFRVKLPTSEWRKTTEDTRVPAVVALLLPATAEPHQAIHRWDDLDLDHLTNSCSVVWTCVLSVQCIASTLSFIKMTNILFYVSPWYGVYWLGSTQGTKLSSKCLSFINIQAVPFVA